MVRAGRRVRALVATAKGADSCDSPKRKDQRLEFPGKLSHTMVPTNSVVKSQIITDFFHVVQEHDVKIIENEQIIDTCPRSPKHNGLRKETNNLINAIIQPINGDTIFITNTPEKVEIPSSTTPHRIELCLDTQGSPTSALSQLHIAFTNKKGPAPKARRKLNTTQNTNEVLRTSSKDDTFNKNNATTGVNNHTLTEYFPVRRSVRKTKRTVLEEKQKTLEQCLRNETEEGLEIHNFSGKGRGIVASQTFGKGDFVVEYRGELIDMAEAKRREIKYAQDQNTGCYMYYFKHKNLQYCVDATAESGYLGRLVNHSRNGNLVTRTVSVDGRPRLVLIAKEDIMQGEEVTYDYGDRSKESLKYHPWLAS
ncbi:PR/SET domain containing protein 7 [Carabus blaptoides fortunei]